MDDFSPAAPEPGDAGESGVPSGGESGPDPAAPADLEAFSLGEYPAAPAVLDDYPTLGQYLDDGVTPADAPAAPAPSRGRLGGLRRRLPTLGRIKLWTRRRKIATGGGLALALVLVAGLAVFGPRLAGSPTAAASPALTVQAVASPAPATPDGTATGSGSASARPSASAAPTATPSPTPTPLPIPSQTAPTGTITFNNLVLDSASDPNRTARTFIFTSDGPGVVSAQVVTSSPSDNSRICITMDESTPVCQEGATPGFPIAVTKTERSRWTVTLISVNEASPTIDVAFSWPAKVHSIQLISGRFQGSPNPDSLRSLQATILPRVNGTLTLQASWAPTAARTTIKLLDLSSGKPSAIDTRSYTSGTSANYKHSLTAGRACLVELINDSKDADRPNLTATITFP